MAENVFTESMKIVGADRKKWNHCNGSRRMSCVCSGDAVMACLFEETL